MKKFSKLTAVTGLVLFCVTCTALADPPSRVARLSYMTGTVTFDPAGAPDWVNAQPNRPFVVGDSLWADADGQAELNLGAAAVRIDHLTNLNVTNLDDQIGQFQLTQGTVNLRVRALRQGDIYEVDTPNLALTVVRPGSYTVTVDPAAGTTQVVVRSGAVDVNGEGAGYAIDASQSYVFSGTDLSQYNAFAPSPLSDFERFAVARDQRWDRSESARYVAPEVIGYEDLDTSGSWRDVPEYGNVWVPTSVGPNWAPYQDGHWAWIEPWGWTWVDAAPWGFAPFHYGRWVQVGPTWGWIPGPLAEHPVYSPALVAFIGGQPGRSGFEVTVGVAAGGAIGWFPLGPREIYRPAYPVSVNYVRSINVSNTNVSASYVTNVYNGPISGNFVNQRGRAVTVVSTANFAAGKPVQRAVLNVPAGTFERAQVTAFAPVAPQLEAVQGSGGRSFRTPPPVAARMVVAHAPARPIAPFAERESALRADPGRPAEVRPAASNVPPPRGMQPAPILAGPAARAGSPSIPPSRGSFGSPAGESGTRFVAPPAPSPARIDSRPIMEAPPVRNPLPPPAGRIEAPTQRPEFRADPPRSMPVPIAPPVAAPPARPEIRAPEAPRAEPTRVVPRAPEARPNPRDTEKRKSDDKDNR